MRHAMAQAKYILGLGILTASASASAEVPPTLEIRSAVSGGSGCPSRNVIAGVSPDHERVYIMNGALEAAAGPGRELSDSRKFCQITLDLDYPAGYSFAVSGEFPYRGAIALDEDVTAVLQIERFFSGEPMSTPIEFRFDGPLGRRTFAVSEPVNAMSAFSPCGVDSLLNIKSSVRVSNLQNRDASGSIRVMPPWGMQVLHLHWKRCND